MGAENVLIENISGFDYSLPRFVKSGVTFDTAFLQIY